MSCLCKLKTSAALFPFNINFSMALLVLGIDIIGRIIPKRTRGHEYVLVAIG